MKTLVPVLETFVGIRVRVELRDGVEIAGVLDEVSFPLINMILLDVVVHGFEDEFVPVAPTARMAAAASSSDRPGTDGVERRVVLRQRRRPTERRMDRIFVAGHRIQYVHFPDRVSMARQLAVADKRIAQAQNMYSRGIRPDKKPRGGELAASK
jgi:small nuclear ribonucleoprotein (snRNP)-like protein